MAHRLALSLTSFALAFAACGGVLAAELGEAKVVSYIGQQLVADIELTAIEDPAAAVQVRLASIDVYSGASLDMPAVLGSLRMSVMRRDGRQFLHIVSLKPVESERLHLFLELTDGARRVVRQATLALTPDPTPPAPPVPPAPPPAPVITGPAEPAQVPIRLASLALVQRRPAACPKPVEETGMASACVALDTRNAALREQIVKLEDKVKVLQAAMLTPPAPPRAAAPMAEPAASKPVPKPRAPAVARAAEPAPGPALPWDWIGGVGAAVFALVGIAVAWRSRRKNTRAKTMAAAEPRLD
jgi:hypothetical protein